jgi:uncharacterized membrane protein YgdD (TMEM256/DUF423 family)
MIYLFLNNTTMGPYSLASVEELWRQGTVTGFTQCCQEGSDQWLPLASVMAAPVRPVVVAQVQPVMTERTSKELKSRLLIGWAIATIGALAALALVSHSKVAASIGGIVFLIGLVIVLVTEIKIWWRHS